MTPVEFFLTDAGAGRSGGSAIRRHSGEGGHVRSPGHWEREHEVLKEVDRTELKRLTRERMKGGRMSADGVRVTVTASAVVRNLLRAKAFGWIGRQSAGP